LPTLACNIRIWRSPLSSSDPDSYLKQNWSYQLGQLEEGNWRFDGAKTAYEMALQIDPTLQQVITTWATLKALGCLKDATVHSKQSS